MSEREHTIANKTDTPTVEQLKQQLDEARGNPDVTSDQVVEIAMQLGAAKKLEAKVIRDAEAAATRAEHDEKMQTISPLLETCQVALKLLTDEVGAAFVAADIHSFTLTVKDMHTDKMLTGVKCAGPGLPSTKSASTGTGERRGRNVYTLDGNEYSSKELLTAFGQEHYGDKYLDAVGFSHRADALAEKIGASKSKRENGS